MATIKADKSQKTFVITGAAGGLGWAITECLSRKYTAKFLLVDVSTEKLRQREIQLRGRGI
ncbi:hypothetical protein [Microbulbifer variabilis]|uniref:hypothetical protein n=1 Tax=Microbulbifer variabilis TaxID=266805 RepID=UPI001CFE244E|nr:hypothetical protein [Microbulbifer variabilis]